MRAVRPDMPESVRHPALTPQKTVNDSSGKGRNGGTGPFSGARGEDSRRGMNSEDSRGWGNGAICLKIRGKAGKVHAGEALASRRRGQGMDGLGRCA